MLVNIVTRVQSQPEFRKEDEPMADAAINEPDRSSSQPEVKTEDDMAYATPTKPLEQDVVDLEDAEIAGADLESECLEKSELLLSIKSQVHPEGDPGGPCRSHTLQQSTPLSSPLMRVRPTRGPGASSHSPVLAGPNPSVAREQPEEGLEVSDQSPILQAFSDSSPQMDVYLDDTRDRKKAKTATVFHEASIDESQDSVQNEVISVKRGTPAPRASSVTADQTSLAVPTLTRSRSRSAKTPKQKTPAHSKYDSPVIEPDSRSRPAHQPPLESSVNSTGPNPQTSLFDRKTTLSSRFNSVEPDSSMRGTRSTAREEHNSSSSMDAGTRIVFASSSSAGDSKPFFRFLSKKGVKKVQSVHDCTVLCIGRET